MSGKSHIGTFLKVPPFGSRSLEVWKYITTTVVTNKGEKQILTGACNHHGEPLPRWCEHSIRAVPLAFVGPSNHLCHSAGGGQLWGKALILILCLR
jgi:hypothetical protein